MNTYKKLLIVLTASVSVSASAFNWANAYVEIGNSVDGWKKKQVITLANDDNAEIDLKVIGWKKCDFSHSENSTIAHCSITKEKALSFNCNSLMRNEEIEMMLHGNGNAVNIKLICIQSK
jgi:hypothetical protein